jgi:hypothetical protein
VLLCLSNLVLCNIKRLLYLFPRNLGKKGSLDLDSLVLCSCLLIGCSWRCTYNKSCYYIKGTV